MKSARCKRLNHRLKLWLDEQLRVAIVPSIEQLQHQAKVINKTLHGPKMFRASHGFIFNFLKNNIIRLKRLKEKKTK